MKKKEKKEVRKDLSLKNLFLIFVFACLFGAIWEMVNHYMNYGNWVSRSALIYGPFNPVYGFGALMFIIFLSRYENPIKIFIGGMLLGGGFEYLCSVLQEKIFGTVSWDYSKQFLNINGRTGVFYMVCWGLLALVLIKFIYPFLSKWIEKIPKKTGDVFAICLAIFMVVNITVSILACMRQTERFHGKPATNEVERFLDNTYPDDRLDKIYQNKKIKN